jgi:hypothetical protein
MRHVVVCPVPARYESFRDNVLTITRATALMLGFLFVTVFVCCRLSGQYDAMSIGEMGFRWRILSADRALLYLGPDICREEIHMVG